MKRINVSKGMRKTLLSVAVMTLAVSAAMAQGITGKVVDETDAPMEFVNVVLLSRGDSTFIAGTVTDEAGGFGFAETPDRPVLVRLSSVGYASAIRDVPPSGQLGAVAMEPLSYMLGEVTVKADRPVTTLKGNAFVTSVEGSQLAHAGNANDVLKQVPMVLGQDGNFEVFGKGAPAIYVNGRLVQDLAELSQINSADIKNVEVITNPGAKYDASVKSVIRIRTRRPKGEGFSATARAQGVWQEYLRNLDWVNLKYRNGGLEVFGNFGYIGGKFQDANTTRMLTSSSRLWNQMLKMDGHMSKNDFFGKAGLSYIINDRHSIGAYYSNGFSKSRSSHSVQSDVSADGVRYDGLAMTSRSTNDELPRHHANLYYNGTVGKLGVDFNMDYMWRKTDHRNLSDEASENYQDAMVRSLSVNHSRLFAEKLVMSYPVGKGGVEFGEEYTSSRFATDYKTDAAQLSGNVSRVNENGIAAFVEIGQQFGRFNISAGLRYEHVSFDYSENGVKKKDQSKTYDNLFPSLSVATRLGNVRLALSYTSKTRRPGYSSLDGTIDYINRFTFEGGNPYLKPEKIHSAELMASWRQFFAQLSYTRRTDPILNTTVPYADNGEIKLITKDNFPRLPQLQFFVGGQFNLGIWYPKVNAGVIKQWLTIDYLDGLKRLDQPLMLVQFQNALHLPGDIWLNVDMQWMSEGNSDNFRADSSSYLNTKIYKAFLDNRLSITLEANDIFNRSPRDFTFYNKDVTIFKTERALGRSFSVTVQYTFNTSRDRYKGGGAGATELSRF